MAVVELCDLLLVHFLHKLDIGIGRLHSPQDHSMILTRFKDHGWNRPELVASHRRDFRLPVHFLDRNGLQFPRSCRLQHRISLRRAKRLRNVGKLLLCGGASCFGGDLVLGAK